MKCFPFSFLMVRDMLQIHEVSDVVFESHFYSTRPLDSSLPFKLQHENGKLSFQLISFRLFRFSKIISKFLQVKNHFNQCHKFLA